MTQAPNLGLKKVCKITPYRIEYQSMGMVPPEVWEV